MTARTKSNSNVTSGAWASPPLTANKKRILTHKTNTNTHDHKAIADSMPGGHRYNSIDN